MPAAGHVNECGVHCDDIFPGCKREPRNLVAMWMQRGRTLRIPPSPATGTHSPPFGHRRSHISLRGEPDSLKPTLRFSWSVEGIRAGLPGSSFVRPRPMQDTRCRTVRGSCVSWGSPADGVCRPSGYIPHCFWIVTVENCMRLSEEILIILHQIYSAPPAPGLQTCFNCRTLNTGPMKLRTLALLLCLCLFVSCGVRAKEPVIRVQIIANLDRVTLVPGGTWHARARGATILKDGSEVLLSCRDTLVRLQCGTVVLEDTLLILSAARDTGTLLIRDVPYGIGWWWEGKEDRRYEGELRARVQSPGRLSLVISLPVERYLRGVVPYEIGTAPFEALRAQSVAARSEAFAALRNRMYANDGYDICGDVDCQVFGGITRSTAEIDRAIRATRGIILQSRGAPINAFFASNCGGHSESVENVWPGRSGPQPYWSAHIDADTLEADSLNDEGVLRRWLHSGPATYCNPLTNPGLPDWSRKYWRWEVPTAADSIKLKSTNGGQVGRLLRIDSVRRGNSGRILSAVFVGEQGRLRVSSELEFRQAWNPPLRSSCVVITPQGPPKRPDRFLVKGAGWGHGVGMCQSGAVGMALAGRTAEQILHHYYPTADIVTVY